MKSSENRKNGGSLQTRLAALPDEFSDFADIYERDIRPALMETETKRQKAFEKARTFGIIAVIAGIAVVAVGLLVFKSPFIAIAGAIASSGFWFYGYSDLQKISGHAKEMMVNPVAQRFGITYRALPSEVSKRNLEICRALDVVPSWDRETLQDEMIGERNGIPFEFFEAHLQERRTSTDSDGRTSTSWVTVFRGQCWVLKAPKTFFGTTRIARDSGVFNALGAMSSKVSRVKLEDPEFEKLFEVYGTDQVEARYLLTPDVMQAFLDLEKAFERARLRCTFSDNKIYVAAEGGDLFEPGSMFKSLDNPDRVGDLLEDFAMVFHLIDVLGN